MDKTVHRKDRKIQYLKSVSVGLSTERKKQFEVTVGRKAWVKKLQY